MFLENLEIATAHAINTSLGKTITNLILDDFKLRFIFSDDGYLDVYDASDQCCERRYMRTDDSLADYVGAKFLGVEVKDAEIVSDEEEEEVHEVQFLEIKTDKGFFTMSNHNEHSGYYSGFCIVAKAE